MKNPWRESCTATPKFCPEEEIDLRADLQQGQNFDVQSSGERGRGRPARDDVEYRNVYVAPKSRNDVPLPAEVVAWMRENGEWALWEGGTGGTKSARSNYTQANAMKARSGVGSGRGDETKDILAQLMLSGGAPSSSSSSEGFTSTDEGGPGP